MEFYDSQWFTYLILPLLIFLARIVDVTLGTIRIVMVSKGQKLIAPFFGFFEVLIWLVAMSKIVENLDNWACYVAYGAGFATGNYIGLLIEEKLAVGILQIQIITQRDAHILIDQLKQSGYGITYHEAKGAVDNVDVIYSIIRRNDVEKIVSIIREHNPDAFYSIGDVRYVSKGIYTPVSKMARWRKGK